MNEWTLVTERFPKENEDVLVCLDQDSWHNSEGAPRLWVARFTKKNGWTFVNFDFTEEELDDVIAWMPIPKPIGKVFREEERERCLSIMRQLSEVCGKHCCYRCKYGLEMLLRGYTDDLGETTTDDNLCGYYDMSDWEEYAETNTRDQMDGFKTVDNGDGYWITNCPYFKSIEEEKGGTQDG